MLEAINRQMTHYAAHVGQIVLLAKHYAGANWRSRPAFDAVRLTHASPMADLDLFWARIADTEGGALGTNGGAAAHGVIFPAATAKATTDQDIYGAYLTLKPVANWTIEPYYFLLKDSMANGGTLAGVVATPPPPQHLPPRTRSAPG